MPKDVLEIEKLDHNMAGLVEKAARCYLIIGVLVTTLFADKETNSTLIPDPSTLATDPQLPTNSALTAAAISATQASFAENLVLRKFDSAAATSELDSTNSSTTAFVTTPLTTDVMDKDDDEMEEDVPMRPTETVRHSVGRGYPAMLMPHYHQPDSRWGPFFEEGSEPHNVTARVGSTVMLDCRIGLLQDKTVSWLHHKEDSIHLLTVGRSAYSSDERITLSFRYPNNYRLEIVYVTRRDEGLYECQVATHPPKVKRIFIKVIVPEVKIVDESGRVISERYYKAGSGMELTCIAQQVGDTTSPDHLISWRHGDRTLTKGISSNVSTSTDSATSSLTVGPLAKRHSGNYTCAVGSLALATVAVHVLNGELPAAVHHGNAASSRLTNAHFLFVLVVVLLQR